MRESVKQLSQRFGLLSQREKLMAAAASVLMLWGSWDSLFYQPLTKKNLTLESEIISLQQQLQTQLQISQKIEDINRNNPNANTRDQLNNLQKTVSNLKQQISLGDKKFVPSNLMANALSDMLRHHGMLKLIKLETVPVTPFGDVDGQSAWMFKHRLVLTVQGDYFNTLAYLKSLESLPWRILWERIDYEVMSHPIAETRIQVYTLSFEKDWLGV